MVLARFKNDRVNNIPAPLTGVGIPRFGIRFLNLMPFIYLSLQESDLPSSS